MNDESCCTCNEAAGACTCDAREAFTCAVDCNCEKCRSEDTPD